MWSHCEPYCTRVFICDVFFFVFFLSNNVLSSHTAWHNGATTIRPPFRRRYFQHIFLTENVWISLNLTEIFPKGGIINIPALVQIMAWHRPGDKQLPEPIMDRLLTHICVTRYNWRNQVFSLGYFCLQPRLTTTPICHYMRTCVLEADIKGWGQVTTV